MSLKPWREVIAPHPDVLQGTFLQSEFAADITAVYTGKATSEYQEASAFFDRTYITEGMRLLLTSVANRLNSKGGDPVIQLQTAFGGGKTHTMLAVYHMATRKGSLDELAGIPGLLDQAGLMDVPRARVAILDGTALSPGQPWKHGKQTIRTLWGELAWQLGKEDGYKLVKEADETGTSPGKDILKSLMEAHAPCVILIDELVAYIRQFPEVGSISGGSYDTNLSFVQSLTEATKLVPNAIVLASLPESEVEAGSQRGVAALNAMEKTFGRIQALWKPVATEEAFEIVRRRLFERVRDEEARDAICRAFADTYVAEGAKMPSETQESHYYDRLVQAYPIHPEVFDRLYEDWTTLEGFQRTRGVLKLMAKVIYRLWKDQNADHLILPGSLPLYDGDSRNELIYYLNAGWDAVLEKDIDGERAETTALDTREPRFGQQQAARRVARTLFLGSAPSSGGTKEGVRGIDRARVLIGCLQPGQSSSLFSDALSRVCDRLHYLNSSGDKSQDSTRFWFDTRANLRREMEDRKARFDDKNEVLGKIATVLKQLNVGTSFFDGTHIFTPHADVPDDSALRLVLLSPSSAYSRDDTEAAYQTVEDFIQNNGTKPRYRGNRLIFVAPDRSTLSRLRDCVRIALAWGSIVDDVKDGRLNIDRLQEQQAKKELATAEDVLPRIASECYRWLLCPVMTTPTDQKPTIEAFQLNSSGAFGPEIERACTENELVITVWSPIHLRSILKDLYWKEDKNAVLAMTFWEDSQRYLYLPRLQNRKVLEQAITKGAASKDFFGTAYGQAGEKYEGFKFDDDNIQLDDTLLLVEPEAAAVYADNQAKPSGVVREPGGEYMPTADEPKKPVITPDEPATDTTPKARAFYGSVAITPSTAM
ncbi:ATP-binding protein [Planctomycetota bacterium]